MGAVLLYLVVMAILFGLAIAVHGLILLAVLAAIVWVVGFFYRPRNGTWFYW